MSKRQIIMLLGVLVIIFPFLGFSSPVDTVIAIIVGLLIVTLAYKMGPWPVVYSKDISGNDTEIKKEEKSDLPFVDHRNV